MLAMKKILVSIMVSVLIPISIHAAKITFLTPSWGVPPDKALLESFQRESGITVEIQSVLVTNKFPGISLVSFSFNFPFYNEIIFCVFII